jgi:hypothetical protein
VFHQIYKGTTIETLRGPAPRVPLIVREHTRSMSMLYKRRPQSRTLLTSTHLRSWVVINIAAAEPVVNMTVVDHPVDAPPLRCGCDWEGPERLSIWQVDILIHF